jgi:hypothetical protein
LAGGVGFGLAVLLGAGASARRAADPDPGADSLQVLLARFTGFSGKLRAIAFPARSAPPVTLGDLVPALGAPEPGVHPTGLVTPAGDSLVLLSLIPFQAKTGPRWRDYRLGYWPRERARPGADSGLPAGFLEVTPENQYTRVSANFTLADFLTHDQREVWPKVLVLRLPLLDKLELIAQALADKGKPSRLQVMSGFRTPQYNQLGVGPRGGRARDSRHMYGDAADVFVDADRDGWMDDLTGDGRVTLDDARYLLAVAEEVEARYPALTGGLSAYRATAAHGPFVHVDVRGRRARW